MRKILTLTTLLFALMALMTSLITVDADPTGASVDIIEEFVVPSIERASPISTLVNPTTSDIKPLEFVGTPVVPRAPIMPWLYVSMTFSITFLIVVVFAAFSLRRHGHRFPRISFLSSIVLVVLLTASIGQAYAEDMTVSIWDMTVNIWEPVISRDSVDSFGRVWFGTTYRSCRVDSRKNSIIYYS